MTKGFFTHASCFDVNECKLSHAFLCISFPKLLIAPLMMQDDFIQCDEEKAKNSESEFTADAIQKNGNIIELRLGQYMCVNEPCGRASGALYIVTDRVCFFCVALQGHSRFLKILVEFGRWTRLTKPSRYTLLLRCQV